MTSGPSGRSLRELKGSGWQSKVTRRLAGAEPTVRVRVARDELRGIRDLTRTIGQLQHELAGLVGAVGPQLLAERGVAVILAARLIGEIAGADRFASDAKLARIGACAPIPVSSGRTDRHRLDPGGNRQLNHAIHMLAINGPVTTREPPSTSPNSASAANQTRGDPLPQTAPNSAASNLLRNPNSVPIAMQS